MSQDSVKQSKGFAFPMGHDDKGSSRYFVVPRTSLDPYVEKNLERIEMMSRETLDIKSFGLGDMFAALNTAAAGTPNTELLQGLLPYQDEVDRLLTAGSGVPYYSSMIGDMLLNPSTVNILTFKKMMQTDDTIYHALDYNISSIVNSIGLYNHKNKEIEKIIRYTFHNLRRGFNKMIQDICTGFGLGFSVLSLKWGYDEHMDAAIIKDVLPLPQSTILMRVDEEGYIREDGIGQFVYNSIGQNIANGAALGLYGTFGLTPFSYDTSTYPSSYIDANASAGDLDFPFRFPWYSPVGLIWLKKQNILHYAHYGVGAQMNPYGNSILRSVYNLWLQKTTLQQFKMLAVNRRSFPLMVVYCNQFAPVGTVSDPNNPSSVTPQSAIDAASIAFRDASSVSTVYLPGMEKEIYSVQTIDASGDIEFFDQMENDINARIKTTLGVPTSTMAGGDGASYALAYMHGQSNSRMVAAGRTAVLSAVLEQFVKPIIEQNFPSEVHKFNWGHFEDEQLSIDEKIKNAQLYKTSISSGILFPTKLEDVNKMREGLGFSQLNSQDELDELQKSYATLAAGPDMDKRDVKDLTEQPYSHNEDVSP